jgi:hypothetical protein
MYPLKQTNGDVLTWLNIENCGKVKVLLLLWLIFTFDVWIENTKKNGGFRRKKYYGQYSDS